MSEERIFEMLRQCEQLPRKQRILSEYLLENINHIMDMTANDVAESSGVGKATLYRMLHQLGYNSFDEFRGELHSYASKNFRYNYWQMQRMLDLSDSDQAQSLKCVLDNQIQLLNSMANTPIVESFQQAADMICASNAFSIIGCRTSKVLSEYFESLLIPTPIRVASLLGNEHLIFDRITALPPHSTVFVIARWPYTTLTIQLADYAHGKGHSIILLTNNITCAISRFSDLTLLVPKMDDHYSVTPFITVIEALVEEICHRYPKETMARMEEINAALEKGRIVEW